MPGADPELQPADPHHHRESLAQPVRAQHVHEDPRHEELKRHVPEFTVICAPSFQARP